MKKVNAFMRIGVCGHFGEGKHLANGQTIKTKIVTEALRNVYGTQAIITVDSHGGAKAIPRIVADSVSMFRRCDQVVMMLGMKGLTVCTPIYSVCRKLFRRRVHYVVIGGWIDRYVQEHPMLGRMLRELDGVYVETMAMRHALEGLGFTNVEVMPNFKDIRIVSVEEARMNAGTEPYRLCTFSRILKEKGIEEAAKAVMNANEQLGRQAFSLDIFGQVEPGYAQRFEELQKTFPEYIRYQGLVSYNQCTDVLKRYFALLFPTYYDGEGFAGTLIDAMSAGVPAVASDWKYNGEIVKDGVNGKLLRGCFQEGNGGLTNILTQQLIQMANDPDAWNAMRSGACEEAVRYRPDTVIKILTKRFV